MWVNIILVFLEERYIYISNKLHILYTIEMNNLFESEKITGMNFVENYEVKNDSGENYIGWYLFFYHNHHQSSIYLELSRSYDIITFMIQNLQMITNHTIHIFINWMHVPHQKRDYRTRAVTSILSKCWKLGKAHFS